MHSKCLLSKLLCLQPRIKFLSSCIFKFLHLLIRNKKGEDLPDSWESQQENTHNPSPPVTKVLDTNKCVCEGGGNPDDKPSSVTYQFNQLLFAECLQNFAQLWDQM